MKRNYLCLLLVMFLVIFTMLFSPLPGICAEENIIVEWDKIFGGSESDEASSLIQTDDGGYAIAGETSSYSVGNEDFWLIKRSSSWTVKAISFGIKPSAEVVLIMQNLLFRPLMEDMR